jgi:hypothetical protein
LCTCAEQYAYDNEQGNQLSTHFFLLKEYGIGL